MLLLEALFLSLALSADAFSVAATIGLLHRMPGEVARVSFHFGLFQSLLAGIGAIFGIIFLSRIAEYDHWVVFVILSALGLWMIYLGLRPSHLKPQDNGRLHGLKLMALSIAVSVDALVAGVGLPATSLPLVRTLGIIGVVAVIATVAGMLLADHARRWAGARSEILAGAILIILGVSTPLAHLGYL